MDTKKQTKSLLLAHFHTYPRLTLADLLKFLHQSAFGCEHLLSDPSAATDYIRREAAGCSPHSGDLIEPLDGTHCRVHLDILRQGITPETFGKLFYLSAASVENGQLLLEETLTALQELITDGELPFSAEEAAGMISAWRAEGFPARRHSETFRNEYHPAYRVIKKEYALFLPLFAKIDELLSRNGADSTAAVSNFQEAGHTNDAHGITIAIEGGSASGKSTLGQLLEQVYGCTVLHMDDFFLRPEQRTPERFSQPGGNVDRERFLEEVLLPQSRHQSIEYRRFDCSTFTVQPPVTIHPGRLTVIEGAYSMHPELADYYDFSAFLDIDPDLQKKRILKRNSEKFAQRFFNEWIPMEHRYFDTFHIKENCDMIIPVRES